MFRDSGNDAFGDAVIRLTGILEPRPGEDLTVSGGSFGTDASGS